MIRDGKQRLFEMMHAVGGMPLNEEYPEYDMSLHDLYDAISPDFTTHYILFHTTYDEETAKKIMSEGFKFANSLHNTTDVVDKPEDIRYKMLERKGYGRCLVVIEYRKSLKIEKYIKRTGEEHPEGEGELSLLPPQFVRGYLIKEFAGHFVENPLFKK